MKNVFNNSKDLKLFGSNGELRYSYSVNNNVATETHFNEYGEVTEYKQNYLNHEDKY